MCFLLTELIQSARWPSLNKGRLVGQYKQAVYLAEYLVEHGVKYVRSREVWRELLRKEFLDERDWDD